MEKCQCCKKMFIGIGIKIVSTSITGNNCVTILCPKCAKNKNKREKMQRINDWKLDVMDGVIKLKS